MLRPEVWNISTGTNQLRICSGVEATLFASGEVFLMEQEWNVHLLLVLLLVSPGGIGSTAATTASVNKQTLDAHLD